METAAHLVDQNKIIVWNRINERLKLTTVGALSLYHVPFQEAYNSNSEG